MDKEMLSEQTQIERKLFSFELRENPRGRFLRITEDVGGRRDTVIVPATGLGKVVEIINRIYEFSEASGPCESDVPA